MRWIELSDGDAKSLHILPCSVKHDGHVEGSKFGFSDSDGKLRSKFQGRLLHGHKVDLKAYNFTGFCLDFSDNESGEETTELVRHHNQFDSILVWEHGRDVDATNAWIKVEELLNLSRALGKAD